MSDGTWLINGNPLAAGSAQVSGTSALSVTIEPDVTEIETTKLEAIVENANMTGAASKAEAVACWPQSDKHCGAVVGTVETIEGPLLITDKHLQAGLTENIRVVVQETMADTEEVYTTTLNVFDQASHALKAVLDNAGANATQFSFKLLEFAQANAQNNIELARHCISVRSFPEILEVQSAYYKRQFDLFTTQVSLLQTLTAEIANENIAPFNAMALRMG